MEWGKIYELVKVVDKTNPVIGGTPHRNISTEIKMLLEALIKEN